MCMYSGLVISIVLPKKGAEAQYLTILSLYLNFKTDHSKNHPFHACLLSPDYAFIELFIVL